MSTMKSERHPEEGAGQPPEEVVDRLAELLPEGALDEAVRGLKPEELSGPGGLLAQLAGRVVEAALEAEMTEHLGHPPGGVPQGVQPDLVGVDERGRLRERGPGAPVVEPRLLAGEPVRDGRAGPGAGLDEPEA